MKISSRRVVLPDGLQPATLVVENGRIARVERGASAASSDDALVHAGDHVVLPGLVDSHVHVNEPGRTDWEGFATATRAAAAGGVTTVVDMPLNSIPATTTAAALDAKRRAATGRCHVDVAFWGGVVPGNAGELAGLAQAGVRGFKCFLSPSGVDEFEHVSEGDLRQAMPIIASLGLPLLVHAESPSALTPPEGDPRRYDTWLRSRPPDAERHAIDLLTRLAAEYGTRVHIVHLATPTAVPLLRAARAKGTPVTVETCPHYLSFAAEEIVDGHTAFKCAPPIRSKRERDGLWSALADGAIDLVATDHSPAPPSLKRLADGNFVEAWGGIASLQLGLGAVWTAGRERGLEPATLVRWMCEAPARLAGLHPTKGTLTEGADADIVIWDPDAAWVVDQAALFHRHPVTPYHGRAFRGRVLMTVLRGSVVYDEGVCAAEPLGRLL